MNEERITLLGLVIDDDLETLDLLMQTLPKELYGFDIEWENCDSFEKAQRFLKVKRYDLVVTDIYLGPPEREDAQGAGIVTQIRKIRFCPVLAVSYGSIPEGFPTSSFVHFADKSRQEDMNAALLALLKTGIPLIAKKLHDELDRTTGSYLWEFLENNWGSLLAYGFDNIVILERLIRRRAAIQIGRLDMETGDPVEKSIVEGVEFYIYPSISGGEIRLGEILRQKDNGEFRAVLTPHCHLAIQPGETIPRAEFILTVKACPAKETIGKISSNPWKGNMEEKLDKLRRRVQSPAQLGTPTGRYWFLPHFLDIPYSYCDFLQLESIPYATVNEKFDRVAVLDAPFAEALQSCFIRFYGAVGLPGLNLESCKCLME